MPDITFTLDDGFGTPGQKIPLFFQPATVRDTNGALLVSPSPKRYVATVQQPFTITGIADGPWYIDGLGEANNYEKVMIDIPPEGGDVTAQIVVALGIPTKAPVATVAAAAAAAASAAVDGLDILTQEVADANYAPVARAVPTGGSTGQVLTKTSGGTAWTDAPSGGGGGLAVVDNGDGTATLTTSTGSSVSLADNGDGTGTITY